MKATVYIDGASRGNPGNAGIGIIFFNEKGDVIKEISDYIGQTTNNIAEYTALLTALEQAVEINIKQIDIFSDSELMVKQINGEYKVKNEGLKPLYKRVCKLLEEFDEYEIRHVSREENKRADKLANLGIDEALDNQELDMLNY
ncbi:MAG: ribonuclease HI family protein [Thermoanaerobacterales bacterium]|jgi:ribonuclease HI|nr:ribonuclease HI family protein [Thermoanaerobacterales bacterium]